MLGARTKVVMAVVAALFDKDDFIVILVKLILGR